MRPKVSKYTGSGSCDSFIVIYAVKGFADGDMEKKVRLKILNTAGDTVVPVGEAKVSIIRDRSGFTRIETCTEEGGRKYNEPGRYWAAVS